MTDRDDPARPGKPTAVPRVRLLIEDGRNRELLAEWLAETYEVQVGTDAADEAFDLCVVDAVSFARNREWLQDRKERMHPVFMPVVLVSRDPPSEQLDPEAWTDIDGLYIIDEIVSVPVEKSVLYRRMENLLERRSLSQQLSGRLERSRERFRTLFDGTPDPVLVLSTNHEVQYVNDAFCAQFVTDREALLGDTLESHSAFSTRTTELIVDHVDRRLAGEEAETTEVSYETPGRGKRYAEVKVSTLETAGDDDAVVIMRDVTERRWFEETLQSLHTASRDLFDAVTETEVGQRIVDTVTDVFELSGVAVYLQSEPGAQLEPVADSGNTAFMRPSLPAVPPDDSSITGHVFATGEVVHLEDIRTSPYSLTDETDMRSGIFAPLGTHGVLVVGSTEVAAFDDRTEKLLALLAGNARTALDRIERERDLSESEQRFRQIADSVHEIIWMTNAAGDELLYLSPGFEELVGRPSDEFGDDPAAYVESVHPDDREQVRAWIETVHDSDNDTDSYHTEYRILRPDGEIRWVEADGYPVRDPDGTVRKYVGIIDDITDLKQRERRFNATFNNTYQFTGLLAPDGTILELNDTSLAFTGYERGELVGEPFADLAAEFLHDVDREIAQVTIDRAAAGEFVREQIVVDPTHDTDIEVMDFSIKPVTNESGEVVLLVPESRDITELKRHERELEAKNERLDQFASLVSHDLRNPLQVALSRLEAARERDDAEEHLEAAEESLHRMSRLIDDVLEMARQGQSVPDLGPLSLEAVAQRAWKSVEHDAATLAVEADETIKADPDRLVQLFENLFRNAVEHGRDDVTVRVGLLDGGGGFYVADDGPGIPEDEREQVIQMGHTTATDGTGFGLAMVEEIATAHGWSVTVTESETGGARFEFSDVYS